MPQGVPSESFPGRMPSDLSWAPVRFHPSPRLHREILGACVHDITGSPHSQARVLGLTAWEGEGCPSWGPSPSSDPHIPPHTQSTEMGLGVQSSFRNHLSCNLGVTCECSLKQQDVKVMNAQLSPHPHHTSVYRWGKQSPPNRVKSSPQGHMAAWRQEHGVWAPGALEPVQGSQKSL